MGIEAAPQGVSGHLVSAGTQASELFLVAEFLPECPADLAQHNSEEIRVNIHCMGCAIYCPVEGPCGLNVVGLEEVFEELDGSSFFVGACGIPPSSLVALPCCARASASGK